MSDTQPIVHSYLTQIFAKHYKMEPQPAAEEALRFIEIVELYGLQLIHGDWTKLETPKPLVGWDKLAADLADIEDSGRTPWKTYEVSN